MTSNGWRSLMEKDWASCVLNNLPFFRPIITKNTLDSSSRIVSQIVYAAGATAGMLGKKTTYTYLSSNTTPDSVSESPYVLTSEDLVIETPAPTPPGRLFNWGDNSQGELGINNTGPRSSPVQTIAYGIDWEQVENGYYFSIAIKDDGTLWAWGDNYYLNPKSKVFHLFL